MISRPTVAVVIPTKGRPAALRLAGVTGCAEPAPGQIGVVDGSAVADSADALAATANATDGRLAYCWVPESGGLTASRNCGIGCCAANIIQFMDDDTTLAPDFLESIVEVFRDNRIGGCCGLMIDPTIRGIPLKRWLLRAFYTGPFRQRNEELFLSPPGTLTPTNTLPGASAFRSLVFERLRYDERIVNMIGEDVDFSLRVARHWRLVITPTAHMTHRPCPVNRQPARLVYAHKVGFFHYHFRKNMSGTLAEWVVFTWMNAGLAIDALVRGGFDGFGGVIDGWRRIAGLAADADAAPARAAIDDGWIGR